jgi:hypothetical protein
MSKLEAIIVGTVVALAPPVFLFFAAWWSAFAVGCIAGGSLPEKAVAVSALTGLSGGVLLDCLFLRRWTRNAYGLNVWFLAAAYLGCAIIGLALCMGVPVFHPLLGAVAGVYVGRKLAHAGTERKQAKQTIRQVAVFAAAVMLVVCMLSGMIAMLSRANLQHMFDHMFGAQVAVSGPLVIGLILGGGAALVLLQYWLARKAAALAYGKPLIPNP